MNSKYILLLTFFFTSCRELVQNGFPDFAPAPVVNCILREGEPLELRLFGREAITVIFSIREKSVRGFLTSFF